MNIFKKTVKKTPPARISLLSFLVMLMLCGAFWAADTLTTVRLPQIEHPIAFYSNQTQDDLRGTFLSGINEAKQSILLIIYSLTDQKIINALRQKAEEGISVTVICDPKASSNVPRKLGSKVHVCKRYANGLMHQKILVVDAIKTWIGSANMTNESLRVHGNLLMGFHSAPLAEKVHAKAELMQSFGEQPPVLHSDFDIGGQHAELWFLPDDTEAIGALMQLIKTAQKTIRVAMFTWTRYDLARAIIDAKNRGVDAAVVIDYSSGKGASSKIFKMLKNGGVPVALSQGTGLLHHKFIYIDSKTLVNGSANWTLAAFTKNDDCFMILHDLTENQKQHMDKLWDVIAAEAQRP